MSIVLYIFLSVWQKSIKSIDFLNHVCYNEIWGKQKRSLVPIKLAGSQRTAGKFGGLVMKLSVKSIVNSLLTVDNALRLYVLVMLMGPVALGFMMGVNLHSGARNEFQMKLDFVFNTAACMIGAIELPEMLLRLPLRGECSFYVKINLLTYALYALVAMIMTALTTNRAMLIPGPWRDVISLLGLVIILPMSVIYFVCWVVMIWERAQPTK